MRGYALLARLSLPFVAVLMIGGCEQSPATAPTDAAATPPAAAEPLKPELNLSREALADDAEVEVGEAPTVLPDLFDEGKDKPKLRTKGRVLTDKEAETLEDSVQGVELSVEFDTN